MATKNAQRRLESSLRSDPRREQGPSSNSKSGKNFLQSLHDGAMQKSQDEMKRRMFKETEKGKGSDDQMVNARLRGASEEDAREIAFQAREQMDFLLDVKSRVRTAMETSKELFDDEEQTTKEEAELKGKKWVESSRRLVNGAVFRYHESCEERQEQLEAFCDWFELYENIWPLPLVTNDRQYKELLDSRFTEDDFDETNLEQISSMWPKIEKMKGDLTKIMSVTTEMGQKALNAELREELTRLSNTIAEKNEEIEGLQKNLETERNTIVTLERDMKKAQQMHEIQIARRNEEIQQLNLQMEQQRVQHQLAMESLQQQHAHEVEKFEKKIETMRNEHLTVKRELENKIASLERTVQSLKRTIEELEGELELRAQQIDGLKANHAKLLKEQNIMKIQLNQVMEELKAERENPLIGRLEKENKKLKSQILGLEAQLEEATSKIESLEAIIVERNAEIEALKADIQEIRLEMSQVGEKLSILKAELEVEKNTNTMLQQRLTSQDHEISKLKMEVEVANEAIIQQREQMKFEMHNLKVEAERLAQELEAMTKDRDRVQREFVKSQAEWEVFKQKLEKKNENLEKQFEDTQEQLRNTEQSVAELESNIEQMKDDHVQALAQKDAEMEKKEGELKVLRDFKEFLDSKVFNEIPTQTDEKLDQMALKPGAQDQGGTRSREEIYFSGAQRIMRKFKTLREKVSEVRFTFENENQEFKAILSQSITDREGTKVQVQQGVEELAGKLAKTLEIAQLQQFVTTATGDDGETLDANGMIMEICSAITDVMTRLETVVFGDEVKSFLQSQGRNLLLEGIPATIVDLEHILEGVEECLGASISRPGSAQSKSSSRPGSATVQNLKPLLALARQRVEMELAETTMDFSKLTQVEQKRMAALKAHREEVQQQQQLQRQMQAHVTQFVSPRNPHLVMGMEVPEQVRETARLNAVYPMGAPMSITSPGRERAGRHSLVEGGSPRRSRSPRDGRASPGGSKSPIGQRKKIASQGEIVLFGHAAHIDGSRSPPPQVRKEHRSDVKSLRTPTDTFKSRGDVVVDLSGQSYSERQPEAAVSHMLTSNFGRVSEQRVPFAGGFRREEQAHSAASGDQFGSGAAFSRDDLMDFGDEPDIPRGHDPPPVREKMQSEMKQEEPLIPKWKPEFGVDTRLAQGGSESQIFARSYTPADQVPDSQVNAHLILETSGRGTSMSVDRTTDSGTFMSPMFARPETVMSGRATKPMTKPLSRAISQQVDTAPLSITNNFEAKGVKPAKGQFPGATLEVKDRPGKVNWTGASLQDDVQTPWVRPVVDSPLEITNYSVSRTASQDRQIAGSDHDPDEIPRHPTPDALHDRTSPQRRRDQPQQGSQPVHTKRLSAPISLETAFSDTSYKALPPGKVVKSASIEPLLGGAQNERGAKSTQVYELINQSMRRENFPGPRMPLPAIGKPNSARASTMQVSGGKVSAIRL